MRSAILPLSLVILLDALCARSAKLSFTGHTVTEPRRSNQLRGRADVSGSTNVGANDTIPIRNSQNTFYVANITLGGATKAVMLDTGR
jgi:hypothetical protein